ncbi:MAG: hypothetical protein HY518_03920 [Candidatus Aenigmarchaeota archaeon]|nr:hypothetical protein [Candidatus Aenigmarchaeota archaeon]
MAGSNVGTYTKAPDITSIYPVLVIDSNGIVLTGKERWNEIDRVGSGRH